MCRHRRRVKLIPLFSFVLPPILRERGGDTRENGHLEKLASAVQHRGTSFDVETRLDQPSLPRWRNSVNLCASLGRVQLSDDHYCVRRGGGYLLSPLIRSNATEKLLPGSSYSTLPISIPLQFALPESSRVYFLFSLSFFYFEYNTILNLSPRFNYTRRELSRKRFRNI